jgi:ParB family chromosome partitioning protein
VALGSNKGLGKGLESLIPGSSQIDDTGIVNNLNEVSLNLIDANPHQPRTDFDDEALKELSVSIEKFGILQPLVVSPKGDHFELIAGERRLRAAKMAGLKKAPVIVREVSDHEKLEVALIENVQRANLNPIEEAASYRKLIEEFGYTQEQTADAVGKSRAAVANKLRLLGLSTEIKRALREGNITEGHAKALLAISDESKRELLLAEIIKNGFNVREVEKAATKIVSVKKPKEKSETDLINDQLAADLKSHLGTKVKIKGGKKSGRIEIEYFSQEELSRIYQKIKGIE